MLDKDLKFTVFSTLISMFAVSLIIGSMFLDNKNTQIILIIVSLLILIFQKVVEIIWIKKTRKISIPILILLIFSLVYFLLEKL